MDQSSSSGEPCGVGDHNGVQGLNSRIKTLNISSDSTNNNAEAWKRWWQQVELYLLATGLEKAPEKRKVAILLHHIGEKGLQIYNTFNLTIEKTTLAEVKSKFDNFFEPRRNITMCRHMFFTRRQQKSESIEGFLADLENKSQDCEFGTLRESLIRDIFIANLHMDLAHVRQRLLQEPDLTYQRMRELARTLVVAQQDAEKIVSSSNGEQSENVMHLRRRSRSRGDRRQRASPVGQQGSGAGKSPNPERRSRTCSRCGQSHRYKCPAQGVKCRSCNLFGHFAKYCFKNKKVSHLESFNSGHSHNNNKDYFVGILNSHKFSQSHKSNCHLKSHNSHYKQVKSRTQSPPSQLQSQSHKSHNQSKWFHKNQSQSQSGNDSGDDIGVIPERSHRDSYSQSEKSFLKSYLRDDSGDNVMSERSKKYLGDESSHQSERSILKSNNGCVSQSVYLNDEYSHMSEESPHTVTTVQNTTVTSPYHSQPVMSSFNQVNTVESKHKHNVNNNSKQSWNINIKVGHSHFSCIIDSGADLNIMSKQTFVNLKRQQNEMSLVNCHINVKGFCGKSIPIMGKVDIKCDIVLNNSIVSENIVFIVANLVCPNVIGLPTCEKLGIIKRVFSVSKQNFCEQILTKYNDVFQGLGCLPPVCHLKLKPDAVPCVDPPRRVPFAMLGKLREELDRMESMQVIEKVTKPTEWVNSIVITVKSSGQLRICLDPRNLNKNIIREIYPLKSIDEIRSQLVGAVCFSHLDAFSGFWMLKLDEYSSDLCTFQTPFGRYKYLRLPFGINASSEIFQRVMMNLFGDLEGVLIFIDDILVYGPNESVHNERLHKVMQRARQVNLKFNKSKCKFLVSEVCFLGYVFSKDGARVDQEKVKAIVNMPTPQNVKELQRILGMINYLGPFISNLSEKTQILRNLLKKDSVWSWDENHNKCLKSLIDEITKSPVLAHYNPNIPLVLSVDSSKSALGAVILQNNKPIAYSSKTLTTTQSRYAQIEKELLAIQFGCEKFHQYVYGHRVTVHTDHKPLVYLFDKPLHDVPARLQRMMLTLQKYDLKVIHVPGKQMFISDTLSRAALKDYYIPENESEITCHVNLMYSNLAVTKDYSIKLSQQTNKDESLQLLKKYYYEGWPNSKNKVSQLVKPYWNVQAEIHVVKDLLFKGSKLIVPQSMYKEMLDKIHEGHQGVNKCLKLARESLYWPNMSVDIKNLVEQCLICAKFKPCNQKEPLQNFEVSKYPWQQVGIDLMYFDNLSYLIVTDYYSKFIEIALLNKNTTAKNVITHLKSIFARHGIPLSLVSDGGPPFQSLEFKNFLHEWDIEHITTSPYHAQSNGQAESSVKIVKNMLKKCKENSSDPYIALLQYRNTPKNNLPSPAQLLMSRNLRDNVPKSYKKLKPKIVKFKDYKECVNKNNVNKSKYYNRNTKPLSLLYPNDHVYFKRKPNYNWEHAIVKQRLANNRSYVVEDVNGVRYRRNRVHLRHKYSPMQSNSSSSSQGREEGDSQKAGPQELSSQSSGQIFTRSGRIVKPPRRLIEEID
uniref:RNA-directed DNA polymerase n=1 Tax=Heliothis virescens TaxID=7102 RepID=A0A2A4K615_HELVI